MDKFIADAKSVAAAQDFQATKDPRSYLTGVFLSKDGMVAGCNGHVAFITMTDEEAAKPSRDYVIKFHVKVPSRGAIEITVIDPEDPSSLVVAKMSTGTIIAGRVISDTYTELARLIPDHSLEALKEREGAHHQLKFQPEYMAKIAKIFKFVDLRFTDSESIMTARPMTFGGWHPRTIILLMPAK